MPHVHSLLLRASGITKGTQEDYRGYMNGQYEDHADACGVPEVCVPCELQR